MKERYSTSRLNTYLHCPKAYWWCYRENLVPKERGRPLYLGSLVHLLLEVYNKEELTTEFIQNLPQWVQEEFPEVDQAEALSLATEAADYVLGYLRAYEDDPFKVISPEVHLELERDEYILYTRVDNICQSQDGRFYRGEYKTTAKMDSAYLSGLKSGLQAGIAYIIMKEVVPERITGTVYSLIVKTKIPQYHRMLVSAEKGLIQRTEECIQGVHESIQEGKFYPSMQCHYYNRACEYLPLCKNDTKETREAFYTKREEFLPPGQMKRKEEKGSKE